MKFVLELNGQNVLLDQANVDKLVAALDGCEIIEHKYMGRTSTGSSEYVDLISAKSLRELVRLAVVSDTDYEAMKFIAKQQAETKSS
jgi:hypothetical protein